MFRYATINDLARLKKKYWGAYFGAGAEVCAWTLKLCGLLFALETIEELCPKRVLEVGGGSDTFFDTRIHQLGVEEYWMADRPWDFHPHLDAYFREVLASREGVRFVECILGRDSAMLPDGYFDMVFSVGVWAYADVMSPQGVTAALAECGRILKPGGVFANSSQARADPAYPEQLAACFAAAGFGTKREGRIAFQLTDGDPTLFENAGMIWEGYYNTDGRVWENMPVVRDNYATILSRHTRV